MINILLELFIIFNVNIEFKIDWLNKISKHNYS